MGCSMLGIRYVVARRPCMLVCYEYRCFVVIGRVEVVLEEGRVGR